MSPYPPSQISEATTPLCAPSRLLLLDSNMLVCQLRVARPLGATGTDRASGKEYICVPDKQHLWPSSGIGDKHDGGGDREAEGTPTH
jgi:hypothetical protein